MDGLAKVIERGLGEIASDSLLGASELYARALELAARLQPDLLPVFGERLLHGRRDMAPLVNLALSLRGSSDPAEELRRRVLDLKKAAERIISTARVVVGPGRRIITISRSSTVLAVLKALETELILCLESLPGGEGRRTVAELGANGVSARMIPDDELDAGVERAELGLIGADVVTGGVIVNKVGTRRLAEGLSSRGKPLYVVADRTKLLHPECYEPPGPDDLFEQVPRTLVDGVIDDSDDDLLLSR
ncbi:hypothetical protein KAU45_07305 [bacterium]|nr:hypothetical protein [bacterium]